MKPLIGVVLRSIKIEQSNSLYMSEKTRRGIIKSGGEVFAITPPQDIIYIETPGDKLPELTLDEKNFIESQLLLLDGLFMPGGEKFSEYDRYLLERAIELKIPILGVCLGMQIMSCYKQEVKLKNIETISNHLSEDNDEKYKHLVKIDINSKLYNIFQQEQVTVNSFHSKETFENGIYQVVAKSEDGIIEAIEYPSDTFNVGVQWHPEYMVEYDEFAKKLMQTFIKEALKYKFSKNQTVETI